MLRVRLTALFGIGLAIQLASPVWGADPAPVEKFGRESSIKVRIPQSSFTPALLNADVRKVADYGSFVVVEAPSGAIPSAADAEVLTEENFVLLNAGAIDTTQMAAKQLQQTRGEFTGKRLHLIQFAGPIRPEWYAQMKQTGVQIVNYIPSNSYLVYGDAQQLGKVQELAAQSQNVQWNGAYIDEYKIDPGARSQVLPNNAAPAQAELFSIQLVADATANRETLAVVNRLKSAPVLSQQEDSDFVNLVVELSPEKVLDLAKQPDVISIQPYTIPTHFCERQDQIIAGTITGNVPTGPGYLAWVGTRGFTQAQFDASNFAVDVTDSGIDNATTSPNHFGLYVNGVRPGTSRVIYNRLVGTPNGGSTLQGCDGHGNLNAHIVCGHDNLAGFPFADASGFHYGLGVCPHVRVGSTVIFDPSNYTFPNFTTIQSQASNSGSRISTNSWGSTTSNLYTTDSQTYDKLVRDAQPTGSTFPLAGNQEMVIVFANGNAGSAAGTVRSPATAKNVISVGAAEGVQNLGGTDQCGWPTTAADNCNQIISFSSRGPCPDGRKKPEIVAPGTHISGGVAQSASPGPNGTANACFTGSGICGGVGSNFFPAGQQFYSTFTGTSHSCPCVAGGCAMIRQFFINQGMGVPSPAMTKALIMNSARYMNGTGANDTLWSNSQGMGELHLGEAFNRGAVTPTIFKDEDTINNLFTASGQTRVFNGSIVDNTKPFRVTLAWTDAFGSTSGNAYNNNLDLTVTVGPNTYKGNVFSGANSITGGSADVADNAESVFLPAGVSGTFSVTVTATNIVSDGVPNVGGTPDQDFAIVIYNASTCAAFTITPPTLPDGTVGSAYSQTLTASGGTAPYSWIVFSGSLPTGLGLSSSGDIIGIPTTPGVFNFTVKTTDNVGCTGTKAYSITVACPAVSIDQTSLPDGDAGVAYNQALTASGGTAPYTFTIFSGTLPTGLSLAPTGEITGTPSAGTYNFTVQVADAYGCTATQAYLITINCPAITIDPATLPDGQAGVAYSQTLTASGGNAPYTFTLQSGSLPPGLSLSGTGDITGTPATAGTFSFSVLVVDAYDCGAVQDYTIVVTGCALLGDVNVDTFVDGGDVQDFTDCVLTGTSTGNCNCADIDGSTVVDELDIDPFVDLLLL